MALGITQPGNYLGCTLTKLCWSVSLSLCTTFWKMGTSVRLVVASWWVKPKATSSVLLGFSQVWGNATFPQQSTAYTEDCRLKEV
jgi:hypothetical protein